MRKSALRNYKILRPLVAFFTVLWTRMRRENRRLIPKEGGAVLVSNHICLWDFAVIACMTRRPVTFVAKQEVMKLGGLVRWAVRAIDAITVDRGKAELSVMKEMIARAANGELVLIFIEGTRNRSPEGVEILPLQAGAAMVALRSRAPVIPLWIKGRYHPFAGIRVLAGEPVDLSGIEDYKKASIDEATVRIGNALLGLRKKLYLTKK